MVLEVSWERDGKDEVCGGKGPAVDLTPESLKSPRSGCLARGHGMSKTEVSASELFFLGKYNFIKRTDLCMASYLVTASIQPASEFSWREGRKTRRFRNLPPTAQWHST